MAFSVVSSKKCLIEVIFAYALPRNYSGLYLVLPLFDFLRAESPPLKAPIESVGTSSLGFSQSSCPSSLHSSWNFRPVEINLLSSQPAVPGNHHSSVCLWLDYFRYFYVGGKSTTWLSVTRLFHLTYFSQGSFVVLRLSSIYLGVWMDQLFKFIHLSVVVAIYRCYR